MSNATRTQPEVGMGATYGIGSDSYPYTIVSVELDKAGQPVKIKVRGCDYRATPNSNYYGNQEYTYTEREDAPVETWKWDAKNTKWRRTTTNESGRVVWAGPARGAGSLFVGERRARQNPSF